MNRNIKMHNRPEGNPSKGVGSPNTFITPARHRILSFALAVCLLLGGIIWQSPMTIQVQAADANTSEMQAETWTGMGRRYIEFGKYNGNPILWRVLEVKDNDSDHEGAKTAFLLADDLLRDSSGDVEGRQFHSDSHIWSTSDIRGWLNGDDPGEFLHTDNFDPTERSAILPVTLDAGNDTAAVFLLSEAEAKDSRYFTSDADRAADSVWWLRSPYFGASDSFALVVGIGGHVDGINVGNELGVRPALKVNLSSDIFTSQNPLYGVEITVKDGSNPVTGARISFSGASASDAIFSNAYGRVAFNGPFPAGDYTVTVEKAGYETATQSITIGDGATSHTIQLANATYLSETVTFGRYNNTDISWKVLTVEGDKALLLSADVVDSRVFGSSADWDTSNIKSWLNSSASGDFLEDFAPWETGVLEHYSEADAKVFLLSEAELLYYLPAASMRAISTSTYWWVRTASSASMVAFYDSGGSLSGSTQSTNSRGVRPALWLDLHDLYLWIPVRWLPSTAPPLP